MLCEKVMMGVQDKDPSILWKQNAYLGTLRWMLTLTRQPRWAITTYSTTQLVTFYPSLLNIALPISMLPKIMGFSRKDLPYGYPTIKLKCFKGPEGSSWIRACHDPQHSCQRNIISFFRLLGRPSFKAVSRGHQTPYVPIFEGLVPTFACYRARNNYRQIRKHQAAAATRRSNAVRVPTLQRNYDTPRRIHRGRGASLRSFRNGVHHEDH